MQHPYTLLCLGDSYTIGEAVEPHERFAMQAVNLLEEKGYQFQEPVIIAQTGWTTDELQGAISKSGLHQTFDFVTLLIGVNNQYRGRSIEEYKTQFTELLQTALQFANNNKERVIVLSIPDWGVTPFAANDKRPRTQIAAEIDLFNEAAKQITAQHGIHFIDITPESRNALHDSDLLTKDGLHPSGKMYKMWAWELSGHIEKILKKH